MGTCKGPVTQSSKNSVIIYCQLDSCYMLQNRTSLECQLVNHFHKYLILVDNLNSCTVDSLLKCAEAPASIRADSNILNMRLNESKKENNMCLPAVSCLKS